MLCFVLGFVVRPNGEIIEYRIYENASDVEIYSGVMQEFVYLRLEPYTNYTVRLEACTAAGCSSADWQIVTTAEIQPENQSPPVIGDVNSTSVNLRYTSTRSLVASQNIFLSSGSLIYESSR